MMPSGSSVIGLSSLGSTRVLENYALVGASKAALAATVGAPKPTTAAKNAGNIAVSAGGVAGALEHFPNREAMLARVRQIRWVERHPEDIAGCVMFSALRRQR
jgi:enoyl-[acyl-carrier protein] reductase III